MTLTSASFFSGVAGMDRGLEAAGFRTVSFSEIEPYANAILASRYPDVPNLGSITDWRDWPDGPWQTADLWAGGPPCQDLSVAGKRAGQTAACAGIGGLLSCRLWRILMAHSLDSGLHFVAVGTTALMSRRLSPEISGPTIINGSCISNFYDI